MPTLLELHKAGRLKPRKAWKQGEYNKASLWGGGRGNGRQGRENCTWFQYWATFWRPRLSQIQTRFRISFWKQDPPKPTEAFRNLAPMREALPMA